MAHLGGKKDKRDVGKRKQVNKACVVDVPKEFAICAVRKPAPPSAPRITETGGSGWDRVLFNRFVM